MPVPPPVLGFTVMVLLGDPDRANSRVLEVDRGGKVRWQIDGVNYPVDVHVLPGNPSRPWPRIGSLGALGPLGCGTLLAVRRVMQVVGLVRGLDRLLIGE